MGMLLRKKTLHHSRFKIKEYLLAQYLYKLKRLSLYQLKVVVFVCGYYERRVGDTLKYGLEGRPDIHNLAYHPKQCVGICQLLCIAPLVFPSIPRQCMLGIVRMLDSATPAVSMVWP